MSLKHGLLGLLNYGSMTGYELDKAFKDSLSFFWQAKNSQIYRELDAMERCGWLTSERVIQNQKPNKRVYSIFFAGERSIDQSLEMLRTYRKQCTESSKGMSAAQDIISEYGAVVGDARKAEDWKMVALYGEVFYDASLNWADKAIALLEEMKR